MRRRGTRRGLYQVGCFIGDSWQEWNGKFRDDVRSYLKGDAGAVSRLLASPDLYGQEEREPEQSVNFVTCHDGFTLNDLVPITAGTTRRTARRTGTEGTTT